VNKEEKAKKILSYLGREKSQWITTDCSPPRKIAYTIQGIVEKIYTYTDDNLTDSYRSVARAVVDAGLDYGNCIKIVTDEINEIKERKMTNESLSLAMKSMLEQSEKTRISKLSNTEKLAEINEKYRIKIIKFEAIDD